MGFTIQYVVGQCPVRTMPLKNLLQRVFVCGVGDADFHGIPDRDDVLNRVELSE